MINKQKVICEYDNNNQNKIMSKEISMSDYKHNKIIIHSLYDNQTNLTLKYVLKTLENKTINLGD